MRAPEGLDGVIITDTKISGLNSRGCLVYRGYDVERLVEKSTFADVTWLLWNSRLPTEAERNEFRLKSQRLIVSFAEAEKIVRAVPRGMSPMRSLPIIVAVLSELKHRNAAADEFNFFWVNIPLLLVLFARSRESEIASLETDWSRSIRADSMSHAILCFYHGTMPSDFEASIFDHVRTLYAEHGLNASTFAARVVASTQVETEIALAAAFGAFGGEIHGGAIEQLMSMLDEVSKSQSVSSWVAEAKRSKRLVMGFGHRIYKGRFDVRFEKMRAQLVAVCRGEGIDDILKLIDSLTECVGQEMSLYPNLDLACGPTLERLGFSRDLFVPLTAASRLSGWCAHIAEQRERKKLIRPSACYTGADQIEV